MTQADKFKKVPTLCWDCAKAIGGCSWADEFKPVKGWKAIVHGRNIDGELDQTGYKVLRCPEFKRDAIRAGQVRYKEPENELQKKFNESLCMHDDLRRNSVG